ncbi:hypothetical protein [Nostoc sp.]
MAAISNVQVTISLAELGLEADVRFRVKLTPMARCPSHKIE